MILSTIDHVGVAVPDLEEAIEHHRRCYDAEVAHREEVPSDGVREALIRVGDGYIQLLEPTRDDSPVARFLARNGPGLHHVGYRVDDCGAALERLKAEGVRVIDEQPRPGSRGTTVAFVHPKAHLGTLVELVEVPAT
jgi:methylmalonyl-CoA epimerase